MHLIFDMQDGEFAIEFRFGNWSLSFSPLHWHWWDDIYPWAERGWYRGPFYVLWSEPIATA